MAKRDERFPPSSAAASKRMRANPSKNNEFELRIRKRLHSLGYRYRVDYPVPIPEMRRRRIDIAFPSKKLAVFLDGCYWHGCPLHGSMPKANQKAWEEKIRKTQTRDKQTTLALEKAGWTVLRFWEHDSDDTILEKITSVL